MPTDEKLQSQQIYQNLMVEAKERIASINLLTGDQRGIPSPIVREFDILQIRMLCEIVGLACLVAHGELVDLAPANLKKQYAPGQIFAALGDLHDDFYPVPMTPQKVKGGWHFAEYEGAPYATKEELPQIWAKCGDVLHRGSLKNLIKAKNAVQNEFADVVEWGQKIANLLNNHRIVTLGNEYAFVTLLHDGNGEVKVALGQAIADQQDVLEAGETAAE